MMGREGKYFFCVNTKTIKAALTMPLSYDLLPFKYLLLAGLRFNIERSQNIIRDMNKNELDRGMKIFLSDLRRFPKKINFSELVNCN